jgi:hypothetical protein
MEFFKPGRTFDFMRLAWRFWIPFSFVLLIGSIVLMIYPGPNYGTDFRGGTEIEVAFLKTVEQGQVREAVTKGGQFSDPDVVKVASGSAPDRHYLIRVQEVTAVTDTMKDEVRKALCFSNDGSAPGGDEKACPVNARATEVKFSQGGDKITLRYDAEPDMAKISEQIAKVPSVVLRKGAAPQVISARDHRVELQLQSRGDQLLDVGGARGLTVKGARAEDVDKDDSLSVGGARSRVPFSPEGSHLTGLVVLLLEHHRDTREQPCGGRALVECGGPRKGVTVGHEPHGIPPSRSPRGRGPGGRSRWRSRRHTPRASWTRC